MDDELIQVTQDDLIRWLEKLDKAIAHFDEKGDQDYAKMMRVTAALMRGMVLDIEVASLESIFPITGGEA